MQGLDFEGYDIPSHTKQCLEDYYYHGLLPGGFIACMLRGDYEHAVGLADIHNFRRVDDIRRFIEDKIPEDIRGSTDRIHSWVFGKDAR